MGWPALRTPTTANLYVELLALVERRRLRRLDTRLTQGCLEGCLPGAVFYRRLDRLGEKLAELGVIELVADSIALLAESLADDFELIRRLSGVSEQDRAVSGDNVDSVLLQLLDTFGIGTAW